ncbi:UNVERIFIED_CONTAM: hypothetical protein BEN50_10125 [Euhalothece sp. KZN 001]
MEYIEKLFNDDATLIAEIALIGLIIIYYTIRRYFITQQFYPVQISEVFLIATGSVAIVSSLKLVFLPFQSEVLRTVLGNDRWILIIGALAVIDISLRQIIDVQKNWLSRHNNINN